MKDFKIDFSEVENVRFKCQLCGECCFGELIMLTTTEINNILQHLKNLSEKEIKNFVFDCFLRSEDSVDPTKFDDYLKSYKNTMFHFFVPYGHVICKEANIVWKYFLFSFPTSKRCVFFDPVKRRCFIYSVRPNTCRLYPFDIKKDNKIFYDQCNGIGIGKKADIKEIENIAREVVKNWEKDNKIVDDFIKKNNFTLSKEVRKQNRIEQIKESRKRWFMKDDSPEFSGKKLIDPFVKLGIVPPSFRDKIIEAYGQNAVHGKI